MFTLQINTWDPAKYVACPSRALLVDEEVDSLVVEKSPPSFLPGPPYHICKVKVMLMPSVSNLKSKSIQKATYSQIHNDSAQATNVMLVVAELTRSGL